jgi:LacI family transcriptional regulator
MAESGDGGAVRSKPRADRPRITVRQVAALAHVSTATVSRALAGDGGVSQQLRRRVLEAAARLNYRPNRAARNLRIQRSFTIGVVIPDIQNFFFTGIVRGIEDVLQTGGYTYLLGNSDGQPDRERLYIETLRDEGAAGLIIVPSERDAIPYRQLQKQGVPLVLLDRGVPSLAVDQVAVTNEEGVRIAVDHLIAKGHRRIGFVGGPPDIDVARMRLAGYRAALDAAGVTFDVEYVRTGQFQQIGGYAATLDLLSLPLPPTALFLANNLMTLGAFQALHERGLRIPDDVAVIGFDDMPWSTSLQPPLTAVAQPTFELGATAAQLLLARLHDPTRPFRRVVLDTPLIIRGSCGDPLDG